MGRAPGEGGGRSLSFISLGVLCIYNKVCIIIKYIIKYNKLELWCEFFLLPTRLYMSSSPNVYYYYSYNITLSNYTPLRTPQRGGGNNGRAPRSGGGNNGRVHGVPKW